ncbi:LysE family translocator [Paenibacillus thermotolerans]|uniref:LysE family translocator n=1 Tax=Paenibacillus thermotolerans TaxID=3027807 RepID=UPI0023689830|nr:MULTISPECIES: LysE family transporter [unclassified Paenibacillus]
MMLLKGFKLGMLLQLAVGPICIFIFQIATVHGFLAAAAGALGVAAVDGLYIAAAILGIASMMERRSTQLGLKLFGAAVLFVFGVVMIIDAFRHGTLPSFNVRSISGADHVFLIAMLLTASNPLTILFWAGIFSAKLTEERMARHELYTFGLGALGATVIFLTVVALAGSVTRDFITPFLAQLLNVSVGSLFVLFSFKMLRKKQRTLPEQKKMV